MQENPNHIEQELVIRYLLKELSLKENLIVEKWIHSSVENKKTFEEIQEIWQASSALKDFENINADLDWKKLKVKIPFGEKIEASDKVSSREISLWGYFYKIAAVLVVAIGLGWLGYQQFNSNSSIVEVAGLGEEKEVKLPDGSSVLLNSNSQIAYYKNFKDNRIIELEGEAFFQVVKNTKSPFRVKTKNTITEVLGTSFNVNENEEQTKVTLVTGKVAFYSSSNKDEKILLEKGEQAVFTKGKLLKQQKVNINELAWKENVLEFKDAELSEVINDLENYFKVEIEVKNPELLNCKYTGTFKDPELDKIFTIVSTTLEATIEKKGEKFLLSGEGCR